MGIANVNNLKYSAGMVSKGFWFQEFKKYNQLLDEGYTDFEIKTMQEENNILLAPSEDYGKKMINEVSRRTKALTDHLYTMFKNLPVQDQKLLNLLGVMMTDRLFFEFMYEVYREKLIGGNIQLAASDIRAFLNNKAEQNQKVANFTSQTKRRLVGAYGTYIKEANLMEESGDTRVVKRLILDINLEEKMKEMQLGPYLKIFLGE